MKQIQANKLIKTLNWIAQIDESGTPVIEPIYNKDKSLFECIICLPLIEKTVMGIGQDKIEAIDNATKQTSALIDDYMKENPTVTIKDFFGGSEYILEEDENGYLFIHIN